MEVFVVVVVACVVVVGIGNIVVLSQVLHRVVKRRHPQVTFAMSVPITTVEFPCSVIMHVIRLVIILVKTRSLPRRLRDRRPGTSSSSLQLSSVVRGRGGRTGRERWT